MTHSGLRYIGCVQDTLSGYDTKTQNSDLLEGMHSLGVHHLIHSISTTETDFMPPKPLFLECCHDR